MTILQAAIPAALMALALWQYKPDSKGGAALALFFGWMLTLATLYEWFHR